jgi:hypothetical protein
MLIKSPIWEPKGTKFRPYNLSTLIAFYVGRLFGSMFRRLCRKGDKRQMTRSNDHNKHRSGLITSSVFVTIAISLRMLP